MVTERQNNMRPAPAVLPRLREMRLARFAYGGRARRWHSGGL